MVAAQLAKLEITAAHTWWSAVLQCCSFTLEVAALPAPLITNIYLIQSYTSTVDT